MSISKKILLVSLMVTGSFYAKESSTIVNNTTVHTKPAEVTKTLINRAPTPNEVALANAKAAKELSNLNKPWLEKVGENLDTNIKYLFYAQPFDVEHGFIKGVGIVAVLVGAYTLYECCYKNTKKSE